MKKFVQIQSSKNIEVTEGLIGIDMTNKDAHVPDRLRVASAWVQTRVLVRTGQHWYPGFIQEWNSVKALVADKILTIGAESDTTDEQEAIDAYERVTREMAKREQRAAAAKADEIERNTPKTSRTKTNVGDITGKTE